MRKNIISIILTIFLLSFLSVAYAAFSTNYKISGEGAIQKDSVAPTCGAWYLRDSNLTIQEAYDQNKFKNPATNTDWTNTNQKLFIECTDNMQGSYGCINVTEITDSNNEKRYYREVKEYTTSIQTDTNIVTVTLQDAYLNSTTCTLPIGSSNPYLDKQGPTGTITQSASNKFTYSATDDISVQGYMVTNSPIPPSLDDLNWISTPSEITIDNNSAKTYYVWIKDYINITSKAINTWLLTKSQGTGTTLSLKYDNSTGTELFTGYVLDGTKVYVNAVANTGYDTLVVKKDNTSIQNPSTQVINSASTISSTASARTYAVVFDKNANDATGSMTNQTMTYGVSNNLRANAYVRPGYIFNSWNTAPEGTGTSYADEESVSNLTGNSSITLYAQWDRVMAENIGYDNSITGVNCSDAQCMIDYLRNYLNH